eukprot:3853573-Pyramimonas_sp.AAC.1
MAGIVLGIPVWERSIEAKHRLTALAASRAPHASGSFVNVHLRLPDFKRRLRTDLGLLDRVADTMAEMRTSARRLLQAFSLEAHPTALKELASHGRISLSTATSIIYRLDRQTQQKQHAPLAAAFPKKKKDTSK